MAAVVTTGCLSIDSNIKVKPDGTGTIEQTMLVNSSAMGMMSMMGESGDKPKGPAADEMFSEEKLKAEAAKLGEGVTYVSSTPVTQGEMKGVTAVFAFTDFNMLKLTTSPPDVGGDDSGMKATGSGSTLDMVLSRAGGSSLITLDMFGDKGKAAAAEAKKDGAPENPFGEMPKEMMGMLAPMFKDMRVAVSVEPVGQLVRTNATHVNGQKITVLDIAFGELLADPAGFEKMEKLGNNPSLEQIRTALAGVKGIKVNEVEKLEIEFR
jgi:hypothetical protein